MADLKEFLSSLATDPARLGEFIRDPDAVAKKAELSDDDIAALVTQNDLGKSLLFFQVGGPACLQHQAASVIKPDKCAGKIFHVIIFPTVRSIGIIEIRPMPEFRIDRPADSHRRRATHQPDNQVQRVHANIDQRATARLGFNVKLPPTRHQPAP